MANTSRITGFRPVSYLNGTPWNGQARTYVIPAGNGTATSIGDVVIPDTAATDGYPACARMTNGATEVPVGVVVGIYPISPVVTSLAGGGSNDVNLSNLYRSASTKTFVWVADDPNIIFEAEFDSAGDQPNHEDVGANYDIVLGSGTDTTTGASSMTIDASSEVTTAATPLRLVGLVQRPDNDITDADDPLYQRGLVIFNLHAFKSDAGTAGLA